MIFVELMVLFEILGWSKTSKMDSNISYNFWLFGARLLLAAFGRSWTLLGALGVLLGGLLGTLGRLLGVLVCPWGALACLFGALWCSLVPFWCSWVPFGYPLGAPWPPRRP